MRPQHIRHRLPAWIAIFAMLLASLVPTLARAWGTSDRATWAEVCTAEGSVWVAVPGDAPAEPATVSHLLDHCPYCSLQHAAPGLPPADVPAALRVDLSDALPSAFLAAPHTPHAWRSAQPRAPPALS